MARQNKPQRHDKRGCWKFNYQKKTVYFGKDIHPTERPQREGVPLRAWDWMHAYIRQASAQRVVSQDDPTVFALCQYYLEWAERQVQAGDMVLANYRGHVTHLTRFWEFRDYAGRRAAALMPADLELFAREMARPQKRITAEGKPERIEPFSAAYIANLCKSVQAAFNWAARTVPDRTPARLLAENPVKGFRPGRVPVSERYIEPKLARRFLRWIWGRATARERPRRAGGLGESMAYRFDRLTVLLIQLLRMTGARPGEACKLKWTDVDWKGEVATLPPERHKTGKRTGKPRVIHLTPQVVRLLRAIERLPGRHPEFIFTHKLGNRAYERGARSEAGEPWNSVALGNKIRGWRAAAQAAGLPIEIEGEKRFVNYMLRHSYATDAIQHGMTHAQTATLIGNTAQVTEARYVHPQRDQTAALARLVAEKRRGSK